MSIRHGTDGGWGSAVVSFLLNFLLGFAIAIVVTIIHDVSRGKRYKDYLDE